MEVDKNRTEGRPSSRNLQPSKPSPNPGGPEGMMCDKSCVRQGSQRSRALGVQKGEGGRLQEDSTAPAGLGRGEGSEKRSHDLRAL